MPNHYHFLVQSKTASVQKLKLGIIQISALSNGFRLLNSGYCTYYNKQNGKSGSLFRQKTEAKLLMQSSAEIEYPFICFQYIHQNPLKANLVKKMEDWEFSSFRDYADLRNGTLLKKEIAHELVGIEFRRFYEESYEIVPERI